MDMTTTQVHMHAPVRTAPPKIRALPRHQNSGRERRASAFVCLAASWLGCLRTPRYARAPSKRGATLSAPFI